MKGFQPICRCGNANPSCKNIGFLKHEGKWYCKIHYPPCDAPVREYNKLPRSKNVASVMFSLPGEGRLTMWERFQNTPDENLRKAIKAALKTFREMLKENVG